MSVQSSAVVNSSSVNTDIMCNCIHTFHGGSTQKVLTRSCLVLPPSGELLACAGDEASLAVKLFTASVLLHSDYCCYVM